MFNRVGIPLIIVALLVLILLVWVLIYRRRRKEAEEEKDVWLAANWTGICPSVNPTTGAVCQREEFHKTNHYRETSTGRLDTWV
jgi:heme/copper-type cytochrome/quinol oxidase subunit 2